MENKKINADDNKFRDRLKDIESHIEDESEGFDKTIPIKDFHILGLSIFINRDFTFHFFPIETEPYQLDGETPIVFLQVGWIELCFENKWIYKHLYKLRHKYWPRGI